jgi:hypothetical protein
MHEQATTAFFSQGVKRTHHVPHYETRLEYSEAARAEYAIRTPPSAQPFHVAGASHSLPQPFQLPAGSNNRNNNNNIPTHPVTPVAAPLEEQHVRKLHYYLEVLGFTYGQLVDLCLESATYPEVDGAAWEGDVFVIRPIRQAPPPTSAPQQQQ